MHWIPISQTYTYILSYNATVFYFDNISCQVHVLNQLFIPNESSISQFPTIQETNHFMRVVEKNEMHCDVSVSDM